MDNTRQQKSNKKSLLERFKNLLGIGLYLLVIGLLIEVSFIILTLWITFPITLSFEIQIALTILCVLVCLSGAAWFSFNLNLITVHLLNGENKLVTKGPFSYVRHPLYAILLVTLPPLMIIWYADILFLLSWILIYIAAHYLVLLEEKGLLDTFGEDYKLYREYVPALIPYKGSGGDRYRAIHNNIASKDKKI